MDPGGTATRRRLSEFGPLLTWIQFLDDSSNQKQQTLQGSYCHCHLLHSS